MSTVNVELAQELLSAAEVSGAHPSRSAAKLIALELFREHRISLGKAAELAGISMDEFMTVCNGESLRGQTRASTRPSAPPSAMPAN